MDSRDKEFLRRFQKLAPEWQRAIVWMIENEDLIAQFQAEVDRRWEDLQYKCAR